MTSMMLTWMLLLTISFQGVYAGQYCKRYYSTYSSYYKTYYCSGYCCGSLYTAKCCTAKTSVSITGVTAGSVGGIIGFCIFVGIIVFVIKACNRPSTQVHVLQTSREGHIVHM
ncbi:uncharacterized protein [Haliotis cracherodii]|uniref:uncharacterized protein n=1 Tax=Haliotis cracherodii TaxID=6455 RepID=UPI0039EBC90B